MEERNEENVERKSVNTIYHQYEGKEVAVQLKKEFFAVVSPSRFYQDPETNEPVRIPVLRGVLRVLCDGTNTRLSISGEGLEEQTTLETLVSPDDCLYISIAEKKAIIA